MIIDQNTDAAVVRINVGQKHIGSALRIVGTISNDIEIERPLNNAPDVDNDAHWSAINMDGEAIVLNDDNPMWIIVGTLGPIRLNKPSGDNVGVEHVW